MMNDAPAMPHHADAFLLAKEIEQRADALRSLGFNAVEIAGMVRETAWRPIESAPKQDVVILYFPEKVTGAYRQSTLPAMFKIDRGDAYPNRMPTHWRPIPAPPEAT